MRLRPFILALWAVYLSVCGAAPGADKTGDIDPSIPWPAEGFACDFQTLRDGRLEVQFHGDADWPNAVLRAAQTPDRWAQATTLVLPLENPGDAGVDLFLRVGDDAKASWPDHAIAQRRYIAPHTATTLLIALSAHPARQMGMQSPPPPVGASAKGTVSLADPTGRLDPSHLTSLYLVVWGRTGPRRLIVGTPRPAEFDWGQAAYTGLIDRFGQFTRGTWSGKVQSDADLRAVRVSEAKFDAESPSQAGGRFDPFGGWLGGPHFAPGRGFRVERSEHGTWWFVTPLGNPFFSLGVDSVSRADPRTFIEGREFMFEELPPPPDAPPEVLGVARSTEGGVPYEVPRFNSGRWINFYALNLLRKYGAKFPEIWPEAALGRLSAWGFNTIGNWSDPALFKRHILPYTVPISLGAGPTRIPGGNPEIADIADPFAADFAPRARQAIVNVTRAYRDDPWLIGYFVDNELPWGDGSSADPRRRYALALRVLAQNGTSPAKRTFVAQLQEHYPQVASFAAAWHIATRSWQEILDNPIKLPDLLSTAAEEDLYRFSTLFAEAYYRTVAQTLHEEDPVHLYLGSRFAAQTPESLAACAKWCDVVSFNIYAIDLGPALADRLGSIDRPVLIGEFNFSSSQEGPFGPGLVDVGPPSGRGPAYAAYVAAAASNPKVVGLHWFQFLDEPVTGRLLDGENSPFGLVSVTDRPYFDLIRIVRRSNFGVLPLRNGLGS
jgi:hypothetical protein